MDSLTAECRLELAMLRRFVREGDESAFAELVDRHADRVFATCQRILRHRALAEEATQEVFFRLVKAAATVQSSLGAWLHQVATRLAIDLRRSEVRRIERERAYERMQDRGGPAWADVAPHVDEAIEQLDELDRRLLVAHFIERRTLRELAPQWGASPATLSRRLRGALARLRSQLQRRGVAFSLAAAAGLLRHGAAEAATPALRAQLGRVCMVSGYAATATAVTAGGVKAAIVATVVAIVLIVGAAMVWRVMPRTASAPHTAPARVLEERP